MTFTTVLYHEIREENDFNPEHPSPIDVKQDYDDILPSPLFVTLEQFEEQMDYLKENNFHTLTLHEIKEFYMNQASLPERSILLTFDDCFQSIKEYAYPILKKYGFHAVSFVVTGWLHDYAKAFNPKKSVCLSKQDLKAMEDVFEYANHTDAFHQRKNESTSHMMEATDEAFAKDLALCNEYVPVKDVFAYPFGLFTDRNVSLLKQMGFHLAFTCENGKNNAHTDPLLLKRNVIPYFLTIEQFKQIVN
ncbi:Poly-beta-1,6-N-acetyl-D-glucosamine N-deacetylase precursor [Paraliobacillus sp. PM-2]|uniref:polysaccharide deacetylase family protein n=1 Tax=Paraliobacillus sp. PM-2 TaxID=1462524 RepID=UPI00061C98D4|nr:polysaccharide deacetylase family protein [Paraliobacillus sp. PM-2]CQR45967.1 Poly-beta-1,6-N-acetyl-D-glucosamine N-deacetylase precursor [Paraliobacillus sp. PM-2]